MIACYVLCCFILFSYMFFVWLFPLNMCFFLCVLLLSCVVVFVCFRFVFIFCLCYLLCFYSQALSRSAGNSYHSLSLFRERGLFFLLGMLKWGFATPDLLARSRVCRRARVFAGGHARKRSCTVFFVARCLSACG